MFEHPPRVTQEPLGRESVGIDQNEASVLVRYCRKDARGQSASASALLRWRAGSHCVRELRSH